MDEKKLSAHIRHGMDDCAQLYLVVNEINEITEINEINEITLLIISVDLDTCKCKPSLQHSVAGLKYKMICAK